ncbi:GATA zinc finger domain-containing protein 14-like [Acyrthosiphon pisum]|uniref:Retrotransposon gag domain-containing protein n=1 Tax=Acyrthosiphon pisum TaxID=7029 RepID=A0A8R2NVQ7_ACYPI|nr:GATA zinc finger domain-containing protein 14-like [Acyrthosiphon pisum]
MSKPIFFKPEFYSGEPDECVNEFIENYNLISVANEWSDDKKIMYLPIYLKKSAKAFYQNYIINNPTPTWSHFELALKEYFISPGRTRMLKAKLTNRKLKLTETVSQFLADFQLLAHKVNPKMTDTEKIDLILEALPPDFYNPVALMNNNTLSDLQKNLRKVESAKATINERNNTHNFDALKAEIESLNQKLVEQNAFVANQLSYNNNGYTNNNRNNFKRYNYNNNNNNKYQNYNTNRERNFNDSNNFKNNKFDRNNYYQSNGNFNGKQHFNNRQFAGNQNRNTGFKNNNNFQQPHTMNNVNKSKFYNSLHQNYDNKKFNYSNQHFKPDNNMNNHNQSNHLPENTNQGPYSGQNNDPSNKKTFNNQKNI